MAPLNVTQKTSTVPADRDTEAMPPSPKALADGATEATLALAEPRR